MAREIQARAVGMTLLNEKNDDLRENFTSCLGALKIIKDGWETEAIPELREKNTGKIGFFAKIFGSHI